MKFDIHDNVKTVNPKCTLGYLVIRNIAVHGTPPSLAQEFFHLQVEAAKFYNIEELMDIPPILGVRSIYKKVEFNPLRHNAFSEGVVRRVIQRKGADYVNSTVMINQYCAIKFLLPFGLYDLDKIDGDIRYELGAKGVLVNLDGNPVAGDEIPFLVDARGAFGNFSSDAFRTKVTLATRNILVVVYADEEVETDELNNILDFTKDMILCNDGGNVEKQGIIKV
ncbi:MULTISPECIES: B3/4 domain-containing protein [Pelosinus]|uniref:B3/4 domain protein n=1 Tax=Pelosinus fermentans B4 TaxID=1149862 RepID=I8RDD6_9FIRM|nr:MULTISPECIES: phenylalanine--tRNA ligase beta subunit-related protein [Pelosinus]EIW17268.1 B3/4 domain protein [Pelosinus fermentans B4]EIW23233.1 B3/4 domain protein [Pelosinus fermentans A11]OAM94026.1 B3/4 domain protein [Pelosinus fermentans DSM 17108]SDQ97554.1 B3/B4 domain-containing protein (DNA/RNA-binding domain of Phe-tRNA-synthetase) [Pelosinus fermentans]